MKRKVVKAIALCSIIGALAIGGTAAYLTDYGEETNTFTVGKVDIELQEPGWKPEEHDKIVATEVITKDPKVANVGKNDAYVYMEVAIPMKDVITANEDGTRNPQAMTEMFSFNKSSNWNLMGTKTVGSDKVYLYNYNKVLTAGQSTEALFNTVTVANVIEGFVDEQQLDIGVHAYAIQSLNTGDQGSDVNAQAKAAWNKYANQNKGQLGDTLSGNVA